MKSQNILLYKKVFFPKKKRERAVSEEQKHRNFQEHTQEREREKK
jgi:hypothetical protein